MNPEELKENQPFSSIKIAVYLFFYRTIIQRFSNRVPYIRYTTRLSDDAVTRATFYTKILFL